MNEPLAKELLDVLCCPEDKQELQYNKDKTGLVCMKCSREYAIQEGILLFSEEKKKE